MAHQLTIRLNDAEEAALDGIREEMQGYGRPVSRSDAFREALFWRANIDDHLAEIRSEMEKQLRPTIEEELRPEIEKELRPIIEVEVGNDIRDQLQEESHQLLREIKERLESI